MTLPLIWVFSSSPFSFPSILCFLSNMYHLSRNQRRLSCNWLSSFSDPSSLSSNCLPRLHGSGKESSEGLFYSTGSDFWRLLSALTDYFVHFWVGERPMGNFDEQKWSTKLRFCTVLGCLYGCQNSLVLPLKQNSSRKYLIRCPKWC